jgi:predicted transcriptional regulator
MAALVTVVYWYASAATTGEMAERMRDLFLEARTRSGGRRNLFAFLALPPFLEGQHDHLFKERLLFQHRIARRTESTTSASRPVYAFGAEHVPQVLWEQEYRKRFAPVLAAHSLDPLHARSVISMMLVKVATHCTWAEAASLLDLPASRATGAANKIVGIVRKSPDEGEFKQQLHELARKLSGERNRTNYGVLRQALADFKEIDWQDWLAIARDAGLAVAGKVRNRHAAIWVCAKATQGDYRLSLRRLDGNPSSNAEVHRRFRQGVLPSLQPFLEEYASDLVVKAERKLTHALVKHREPALSQG